jgi:PAS domain S-box-containing protein
MSLKKRTGIKTAELRRLIEEIESDRSRKNAENTDALSPEAARRMLNEMQTYQIQLEMQNEELRRARVEIEESRARYYDFYNSAPVGYLTITPKGLIEEANLTMSKLLGVTRDHLVGQPMTSFIFSEDQDSHYLHFKQLFASGTSGAYEFRLVKKGGGPFWVRKETMLAKGANGVTVARAVVSEITERKQVEETLKRNEEALNHQNGLFTILLKNLPIGVLMVAVPSGKPLLANDAAYNLLGRKNIPDVGINSLSEVYTTYRRGTQEPYPPEEMPILIGMNGKQSYVDDMEIVRPDGSKALLEMFGSPVTDEQGKVWASIIGFADITVRKKVEEALQTINN